ncbi:NitT/TauT family transport system permease protein [Sporomusa sp. KB1]|nr:NitT/TauT family transport system permease protein [Sporomusa sp. KB1]
MEALRRDKQIATLIWAAAIIVLWESGAWLLQNVLHDNMHLQKLPYFHQVMATFFANFGSLLSDALSTLSRAFAGFLFGALLGAAIAILMVLAEFVGTMLSPYLIVLRMIPVLALAPIVYAIVKNQDAARIILSAFITFFPVAVNMYSGLKSVDKDKKDLVYSYAAGRIDTYCKLMIPAALPHLFAGLKISAPAAITAAILVEMFGASEGIGIKILSSLYYGASSALIFWAAVLTAALLGIFGYFVIDILEKQLIPWEKAGRKEGDN